MKYLASFFLLTLSSVALAADIDKVILDRWAAQVLARRADQSWLPGLYAAPSTAHVLGTVFGIIVKPDATLATGVVMIRCDGACPTRGGAVLPVGSAMAIFTDVKPNKE